MRFVPHFARPFASILVATVCILSPLTTSESTKPEAERPGTYSIVDHMVRSPRSTIDGRTGYAHALYRLNLAVTPGSPESMARDALEIHSTELGLSTMPGTLVLDDIVDSPGATHVRFRQEVDAVPVFRGDVVVSISRRSGRAFMPTASSALASAMT